MKAIATLLQDDPYLKLTPKQRCDKRRERREKFFGQTIARVHDVVEVPVDKTERVELPICPAEVSATEPVFCFGEWVERQRELHPMPKKPWFSIVDEIGPDGKKKIRIEEIQHAVCKYFNVSRMDLLSSRRTMNLVIPRQVAMYLAKKLTMRSLPEIGRRFGGRDHTTVIHAVRKIEALDGVDMDLTATLALLKAELAP